METIYLEHEARGTVLTLETNDRAASLPEFLEMGYQEISREEFLKAKEELGIVGMGSAVDMGYWEEYFYGGDDE